MQASGSDGAAVGRGVVVRRAALTTLLAIAMLAVVAQSAFAWHGNLVVRKVNIGGPANDVFSFKLEKTPNAYQDVWKNAKTFDLFGASSTSGPWIERTGSGPSPAGANQETFSSLWAGQGSGFNDWVKYTVTETGSSPSSLTDYTTSASCSIDGGDTWTGKNTTTGQYGKWSYTTGVNGGKTFVTTTVRWLNNKAYTTTCTFVNRYRARVRVKKTFDDPITAQPSITALINGTPRARANADGTPVSPTDTTLENGQFSEYVNVPMGESGPQSPVTVGETDGDAGDPPASAYTTTISCGKGISTTFDSQTGRWTLGGIKPGQDVTCTLHNVRKPECTPPATGTPPNCTPPPACIPPATGTPPNCTPPPACTPPATGTPPNCTPPPACIPPATGTPPNCTPPPVSGVLPQTPTSGTTPRGTARLRGTVGCATAQYANAYITGSQIRRVTFYVNGKKVKTVSKPDAVRRYLLRYTVKPLKIGSYKVRARVEFTPASRTSAKTFNLQFSRCAPRGVLPTFTG
jgi:hypothetical protein